MAYTPLPGNAVDFIATGRAYTPPPGNAVNFEPENAIRFELPLNVSVRCEVGANTIIAAQIATVEIRGGIDLCGSIRVALPINTEIIGDIPLCGSISVSPFAAQLVLSVPYTCAIAADIQVGALVTCSSLDPTAEIYAPAGIGVEISIETTDLYIARIEACALGGVEIVGQIAPLATIRAQLPISAAVICATGVNGAIRVAPFAAALRCELGRYATIRVPLCPVPALRMAHGETMAIRVDGAISVSVICSTDAVLEARIACSPFNVSLLCGVEQPRRRRAIHVRQERQAIYVRR